MFSYGAVIRLSWVAFLAVWGVGAFNVKRDVRGSGVSGPLARYWLLRLGVALVILLLAWRRAHRQQLWRRHVRRHLAHVFLPHRQGRATHARAFPERICGLSDADEAPHSFRMVAEFPPARILVL